MVTLQDMSWDEFLQSRAHCRVQSVTSERKQLKRASAKTGRGLGGPGLRRGGFLEQAVVSQAPIGEGRAILVGEAAPVGQVSGQESWRVCVARSTVGNSKEGGRSQFTQGSWGPIHRGQRQDKDGSGNPIIITPTSTDRTSLVVQRLRLCASTAGGHGFDPWSGD